MTERHERIYEATVNSIYIPYALRRRVGMDMFLSPSLHVLRSSLVDCTNTNVTNTDVGVSPPFTLAKTDAPQATMNPPTPPRIHKHSG